MCPTHLNSTAFSLQTLHVKTFVARSKKAGGSGKRKARDEGDGAGDTGEARLPPAARGGGVDDVSLWDFQCL